MLFALNDTVTKIICHIDDMHRPGQHQQRKRMGVAPDDQLRRHLFDIRSEIDHKAHRTMSKQLFCIRHQPVDTMLCNTRGKNQFLSFNKMRYFHIFDNMHPTHHIVHAVFTGNELHLICFFRIDTNL
mgnify:CR=1 FL=1